MNYYISALKKYTVFTGRARRAEYWYFFLVNLIIGALLGAIGDGLDGLYQLAILIPSIAVGIRRMHDTNKSGWFILIPIYNLVLLATDGNKGSNKYGPDPKAAVKVTPSSSNYSVVNQSSENTNNLDEYTLEEMKKGLCKLHDNAFKFMVKKTKKLSDHYKQLASETDGKKSNQK